MTKEYDFPVATHSYFRALNINEERALFLNSSTYLPRFKYPKKLDVQVLEPRILETKTGSSERQSLECAVISAKLQTEDKWLSDFRNINQEMFGLPNKLYAIDILSRMSEPKNSAEQVYYKEIIDLLGDIKLSAEQLGPDKTIFDLYRGYFNNYRKQINRKERDIIKAINNELLASGLLDNGWTLQTKNDGSHARTYHHTKKIKIGENYNPRKILAVDRIVAHEIYGHALRGPRESLIESEGFALVIEQLTGSKFKFRRAYRYLAASLGWGIFGKPMNFREVFEIIWRLMVISSGYNEKQAKEHAFGECYRVFRGGRPDIAGAVYLKDIVYFDANIKVWDFLSANKLNYKEFVDIIEGRSTITL